MAALTDLYIKKSTLETILKTLESKNETGIALTISISDETNQYDQNVSAFVSQSKEQREAKANKFYVGNGRVFWENGKITKVEKKQAEPQSKADELADRMDKPVENENLPF